MKPLFITTALAFGLHLSSQAAVTALLNGDFEAGGALTNNASSFSISSWFESSITTNNYNDTVFRSTTTIPTNTTNVLGFSSTSGYVYQQIGTYTVGEQVTLTGTAYDRTISTYATLRFELLAGNDASTGDGSTLDVTLLDFNTVSGLSNNSQSFNFTFDSGNNPGLDGQALWLRIYTTTAGEGFVDNLAVVAVPEPHTALLGGLGLLLLLRRRVG